MILARELTLKEIAAIRRNTSIELECFVHGALCVSYSGQCYMSHAVTGRSGNHHRGAPRQPRGNVKGNFSFSSAGKVKAGFIEP